MTFMNVLKVIIMSRTKKEKKTVCLVIFVNTTKFVYDIMIY